LKVKLRAKIEDAFESAREATPVDEAGNILKSVMALELVACIGGEEVVPFAVATGSHPEKKANFSWQTESFEELGHEKRKAFVVVGYGQALDEMVDGNADAYGEKGEALDEKMGLKGGVSCK
jgi:hypothetical protein